MPLPQSRVRYVDFPGQTLTGGVTGHVLRSRERVPRTVFIEVTGGGGSVTVTAAVEEPGTTQRPGPLFRADPEMASAARSFYQESTKLYDPDSGTCAAQLTFPAGAGRRKVQVSRDYRGPLLVKQSGDLIGVVPLWRLRGTGETDDPDAVPPPMTFRFQSASGAPSATGNTRVSGLQPFAGDAPPEESALPPVDPEAYTTARDATAVAGSEPVPNGPVEFCYVHECDEPGPFEDGLCNLAEIEEDDHAYAWFIAQSLGKNLPVALGDLVDSRKVLQDFGAKFYLKTVDGKQYIIFRGNHRLRSYLKGTRYRATTPTVTAITGGSRSAVGKATSSMKALSRGGTAVAIVFVGVIDFALWLPKFQKGEASLSDLLVQIGMDVTKAVVATVVASISAATVIAGAALVGATLPVWFIVGGTIAASVAIGVGLDMLDRRFGITESLKESADEIEDAVEGEITAFQQMMDQIRWEIAEFERWVESGYGQTHPY